MNVEKLAYMANQMASYFVTQGDGAPTKIRDHIRKFWDPRMRNAIITHLDEVRGTLTPPALEAILILKDEASRTAA